MILFFKTPSQNIIATEVDHKLSKDETNELCWLYYICKRFYQKKSPRH